jgi:predicted RNA methylase
MERLYASTFIAGAGNIVQQALRAAFPDMFVERLDEGIILYRTKALPEAVRNLRFVQNSFAVLSLAEQLDGGDPVKSLVKYIRDDALLDARVAAAISSKRRSFTVMASVESKLTSVHPLQLQKLTKRLSDTGWLREDRTKPDIALWILVRSQGYGLLGLRLTRHETHDHALRRGELKPDLANLLCLLSNPKATDTFLDPCAGHGAIAFERAKAFPYARILAGDSDAALTRALRSDAARFKDITVVAWDARMLTGINDASVDAIVTDPPWGIFETNIDLKKFYPAMLVAFRRVLKKEGRAVLLTSRDAPFKEALAGAKGFSKMSSHDILVSGQKACIWVLRAI